MLYALFYTKVLKFNQNVIVYPIAICFCFTLQ